MRKTTRQCCTYGRQRANRLAPEAYGVHRPVHVIIATVSRRSLFYRSDLADAVWSLIPPVYDLVAACLMSDHLHLLLGDSSSMSQTVGRLKSHTTRAAWEVGAEGKVWQRSFWDHLVRDRENLLSTAEYIVNNPVREGLVVDAEKYRYSVIYPERAAD